MSEPTAEQRASYERNGRAVHRFVSAGATPLLAAAAAQSSPDALSRSAAVVYLRQNASTRIALDNALVSIRGAYNQARTAWQAQQYAAAVSGMEAVRAQCERLYRTLVSAVPEAERILGTLAADLLTAPVDALGAGLGMGAVAAVVLLLLGLAVATR